MINCVNDDSNHIIPFNLFKFLLSVFFGSKKVHWKWSQRITKLLIQCLESTEYMEIRNALILLTKIAGVFPVTRKSGINLEKRVRKGDSVTSWFVFFLSCIFTFISRLFLSPPVPLYRWLKLKATKGRISKCWLQVLLQPWLQERYDENVTV